MMTPSTVDVEIDAETRIKSLIEITEALTEIFVQENTLLEGQRPRDITPLQPEKARLAAAYAQSIRDIAANRASVGDADKALLSELRSITKTFEARAVRQRALIEGARQASEGIVKAVAEEASAAAGHHAYGGPASSPAAAPATAPITVDENI